MAAIFIRDAPDARPGASYQAAGPDSRAFSVAPGGRLFLCSQFDGGRKEIVDATMP